MRTLLLFFLLCPLFGQAPPPLPLGEVIPKVACRAEPRFSYALYLPRAFREDRPWPVLFGFSPGGRGEEPVRLFQAAAERFGWIVVGSNDSRNGPLGPSVEAAEALWKEVNARYPVARGRCAAVGFSGGARMAFRLAQRHARDFGGLISFGAFGIGDGLLTGLGHLHFYLGSGLEDFNHWELLGARRELASRKWKALQDWCEGGHRWPSEEMAIAALSFFHLEAGREGKIPRDLALEAEFCAALKGAAERAGSTLLALRRWQEVARLSTGADEVEAKALLAPLAKAPAVVEELGLEEKYEEEVRFLSTHRNTGAYRDALARLVQRQAEAPPLEKTMIRRVLGGPFADHGEAAFRAFERKDWEAALALSVNMAILDNRDARACVYAALASAQLGRIEESLQHLRGALDRGYANPGRLRDHDLLKPLRGRPEFEALLKAMETPRVKPLR